MFNKSDHSEVPFLRRSAHFTDDIVVSNEGVTKLLKGLKSKKINNDQELIQSDPTSCPQNQKGNN